MDMTVSLALFLSFSFVEIRKFGWGYLVVPPHWPSGTADDGWSYSFFILLKYNNKKRDCFKLKEESYFDKKKWAPIIPQ